MNTQQDPVLLSRIRELEIKLEQRDRRIQVLEEAGKGDCGGDTAAGHFIRTDRSSWHEVPRSMANHPDVCILYHAAGWPNK